ncbi:MAG: Ig-like domain-containing protein [Gemmatimonadota bacterium]|jgi:hypothetical protein
MRRLVPLVAVLPLSVLVLAQACTTREIVDVMVGSMGVQPPSAVVYVGDSTQLTAFVQAEDGEVLRGAAPEWTSSAASIADVGPDGMVRGIRPGMVDITASFRGASAAAHVIVSPPPVYDFTVTESSGSSIVTEAGGADQLTVALLAQPAEAVVVAIASADAGEVEVGPASLTFTSANWGTPRTVTLSGVDDDVIDGDQTTLVTVSVDAGASDAEFGSAPPKSVEVLTRDDESPGFDLSGTGGSTSATEGGASDTVSVVLDVQPDSDVHLAVSVDDTLDAAVAPATLTFTPDDWDAPQPIVFSAVDDSVADGTRSRTISVSVLPGSPVAFLSLAPRTLGATTVDDEAAGWVLAHTGASTVAVEGGVSDSVAVTLGASPVTAVVLDVSVEDVSDATVAPASLIFTAGGPLSQWVTFSAVDDPDLDGDQAHTVTVSVNSASDAAFLGLPPQTIETMVEDDDVAGFSISESGGATTVAENGGTDTFELSLSARPSSDVTLLVESADSSEARVAPTSVTFTAATWDQPRSVVVTGVDDAVGDGDQESQITVSVDPTSDPDFTGLAPRTLTVTTVDDDLVGFTLGETDGTVVNESGTLSDAVAVRLNTEPLATVVLRVTSADLGEVTVLPATLTFTPATADQPLAVVVSGVDDLVEDGDVVTEVTVAVDTALTLDPAYDTVSARTVNVTTLDDENPNIVIGETGGGTSVEETGTTDVFTVILSAQPLTDVVLNVVPADPGEVAVDSLTLTFTPSTWSVPRTVTVTGVDDGYVDGDQVTPVIVSVDAASSDDAWDAVADRSVPVTTTEVNASFAVTQSGGSTSVHESGTTDILTVTLDGSPASPVVLTVSTGDPGEVVADSSTLTFTPTDWSTPKTVTLSGVSDGTVDGPQVTTVTVAVDPGSDPRYVGLSPASVPVTTTDADVAAFTVTETGGSTTVDERGSTDALLVVLDAQPLSNVVLTVASQDAGEVVADSSTLTFTPTDWSTPKTVTLTGVEDADEDGDQLTLVTFAVDDAGSDNLWDGVSNQSVVVTTVDVTAGFTVAQTGGGTTVDESGTTDALTVSLSEQPASNVVMTVTSADPGEVTVDSATLTFTPSTWSTPKTVTVAGVNDGQVDGPRLTAVTFAVLAGSDPAYAALAPQQVIVTTTDDDLAGFSVTETGGTTSVDESGTTDQLTVVLTAQPISNVLMTVTSANTGEVTVDSTTLTFTPVTWNVAKTVTVTGSDDAVADGSQLTDVTVAVDAGSDSAFAALPPRVVTVETTDDEVADFAITESGGSTSVTEGGSSDTFTVVLLARPSSTVTILASSPDTGEVTVSPSSVSFPPGQWANPKTFTVTGVNDTDPDGDQITLILVAVDDANSNEVFADAPDKTVSTTTVDDEVAATSSADQN